jgi:hypothetical protein
MSEKSSSSSSSGIGIGGLIFVVLLVGKLAGFFPNLSWFIVLTSIIWAPLAGILIVLAFIGIGALIVLGGAAGVAAISDASDKARRRKLLKK